MAEKKQGILPGDKAAIGRLLRRINEARRFPDNTDPSVRHVQIMGETLGAGLPYPMLDEERGHCAISLLAVVAALYEARNARVAAKGCATCAFLDGNPRYEPCDDCRWNPVLMRGGLDRWRPSSATGGVPPTSIASGEGSAK